jgi:hypothetical protein
VKVGYYVALGLYACGIPREPACRGGVNTCGVVYKIGVEATLFNFLKAQVPCQLINNRAYHLKVRKFLYTYNGSEMVPFAVQISLNRQRKKPNLQNHLNRYRHRQRYEVVSCLREGDINFIFCDNQIEKLV